MPKLNRLRLLAGWVLKNLFMNEPPELKPGLDLSRLNVPSSIKGSGVPKYIWFRMLFALAWKCSLTRSVTLVSLITPKSSWLKAWAKSVSRPTPLYGLPKNLAAVLLLTIQCTPLAAIAVPLLKSVRPQLAAVALVHNPTLSRGAAAFDRIGRQVSPPEKNAL